MLPPSITPDAAALQELRLLTRLRATPEIFTAIAGSTAAELRSQKQLRSHFDEELVRAALAVHDARLKAAAKLPAANQLWVTRTGVEQATAWAVAVHKARRFIGRTSVTDLCCGIGIDAAALAAHSNVNAIDLSVAMVQRAEWNADVLSTAGHVTGITADVTTQNWAGHCVHADPDRRGGRERPVKRLEQYQPSLEWMQVLTRTAMAGAIKISPAANFQQKFPGCEIELVSLDGECREATVWFGELAGTEPFRATLLPDGETLAASPLSAWAPQAVAVSDFLLDPDPSIVRAGLIDVLAERHCLQRLDPEEEYLTATDVPLTGFVSAFSVQAVLGSNPRELRSYLRDHPAREYEILCRRIPTEADALRKQLPVGDGRPLAIIFCRISGRARTVVATRQAGKIADPRT
ncbi:MAG: class I SAM-dependent methyltransferase [Planctomycetaceae bacterium]